MCSTPPCGSADSLSRRSTLQNSIGFVFSAFANRCFFSPLDAHWALFPTTCPHLSSTSLYVNVWSRVVWDRVERLRGSGLCVSVMVLKKDIVEGCMRAETLCASRVERVSPIFFSVDHFFPGHKNAPLRSDAQAIMREWSSSISLYRSSNRCFIYSILHIE